MKHSAFVALAILVLSAAPARAGMYDQPYAIVESGDPSSTREEARVVIVSIDGKSLRNTRRSEPIEPGKHVVRLYFQSARGVFQPEYLNVEMNLEACRRYRVVAHYEVPTGPKWEPRVHTEVIGECERKFQKK